jgi:hypothetical protein
MTEPTRYDGVVENETFYLETDGDRIKIGPMNAITELIGGETYTLEYDNEQSSAAWLSTDEDNTITFEVREELVDWAYTEELVRNIRESPLKQTGESNHPIRTEVFVDIVTEIWDSKGNIDF